MPELPRADQRRSALLAQFAAPPNSLRGKPFWSWNGHLEKEELLRQVEIFGEMGMGGFFMHSRTGLQTQYLGKEWFTLINACADRAEELGLEAWLYDEDRWPSGSAGGLATADPRFQLKSLRLKILSSASFSWDGQENVVGLFAGCVDGLNTRALVPIGPGEPIESGHSHVLVFTTETTQPHSFYNGNTYLDTLQRAATDHFISLTHERYREACGDRLGRSIRGIFTDEPHHGMVMCHQTETRQSEEPQWTTPFTEGLFEKFLIRFGYDLRARLPELFLFPDGQRISQVKWHYMELIQELFLENWAKPLHDWCRKHHLTLTGHGLHEDSLAAQAVPCGSLMRYYEYLDYPGVDVLGNDNRNFFIAKQLSSVARQLGKPWMLSELYGCTGWQLDFSGHKEIGDWQALYGINLRCHHLAWYSMAGEAKRDYPASIFFQSGWSHHYRIVEDYFSRLHLLLQQGRPVCEVLVINPVESLWAQIHAGWATWLCSHDPQILQLEEQYRLLFTWLNRAHCDFDYGDEDQLLRHGSIQGAPITLLRLGLSQYRVVIVAGLQTIRASTLELLARFVDVGGKVLFAGEPPRYVDALRSSAAADLAARSESVAFEEELFVTRLRAFSPTPVRLNVGHQAAINDLLCQVRRDEETWFIVLLNTSRTAHHRRVEIRLEAQGDVQEWDCGSGTRFEQPATIIGSDLLWHADFPPLAERVFVVGAPSQQRLCTRANPAEEGVSIAGPYRYQLDEPNICVLDFAQFQLAGGDWQPELEILQVDLSVRERLGMPPRSGVMVQPWARTHAQLPSLSVADEQAPQSLCLRFRFEIANLPEEPVELMIEDPGRFTIRVNSILLPSPAQADWFIDPCFKRLPIPKAALRLGLNVIELESLFHSDTDLEPIYLLGTFGVTLLETARDGARACLVSLPESLHVGDVTSQGLPFYSGSISYQLPTNFQLEPGQRLWLQTGAFGGAVISLGKESAATIAWPPYHAEITPLMTGSSALLCQVWLTRRNTFGPLHLSPKEQTHIGPMSFRSTDEGFAQSYQLYPSGLLSEPIFLQKATEGKTPLRD